MNLTELKTLAFEQYRDVEPMAQELFIALANDINQKDYDLLTSLDPERFLEEVEITESSQDLPSDFENMKKNYLKVYRKNSNGEIVQILSQTYEGSSNIGWYLGTSTINITPTNYSLDDLYYKYIPSIDDLASDSDSLVIPDRFKLKTVYEMCAHDALINDEPSDIVARFQEQAKAKENEMIEEYKRTPEQFTLWTLRDPSRNLYKRRIW